LNHQLLTTFPKVIHNYFLTIKKLIKLL